MSSPRTRRKPVPTEFQQELANVLDRLRQASDRHDQRVHLLLGDLLPILESIVQRMEAQSLATTSLTTLRDDLRRLPPAPDQTTVNDLWTRALQILGDITGAPEPRRPFWKRRT
ncbi:hypothetical protein [Actinomadura sp. 7K507]|uniref:hypothetical protein n=1 Tax=Actinomadura sp. 7K507 TaxID=2530365 RepID=UPI00104ACCD2|nr:hypothetical protein [Actinomadura sp. 7K507]TDC72978.1 hypothetical protein E1285_44920 [Actinomadura sp. 7K507]